MKHELFKKLTETMDDVDFMGIVGRFLDAEYDDYYSLSPQERFELKHEIIDLIMAKLKGEDVGLKLKQYKKYMDLVTIYREAKEFWWTYIFHKDQIDMAWVIRDIFQDLEMDYSQAAKYVLKQAIKKAEVADG